MLTVDDDSSTLPADDDFHPAADAADGDEFDEFEAGEPAFDADEIGSADSELDDSELDDSELGENGVPVIAPISDPIATARRRHGAAGAMLAAGMFGADIALGRKVKEEAPVVITASSDPTDIDTDGIVIPIDEARSVFAPPQPPSDPFPPRRPRK